MKRVFEFSGVLLFVLLFALGALLAPAQTIQPTKCTLAAAGATCTITSISDFASLAVQLSGTWEGTLHFQGTVDGVNWQAIAVMPPATTGQRAIFVTANGVYHMNVAGLLRARVTFSERTSGSVKVTARPSMAPAPWGTVPAVGALRMREPEFRLAGAGEPNELGMRLIRAAFFRHPPGGLAAAIRT